MITKKCDQYLNERCDYVVFGFFLMPRERTDFELIIAQLYLAQVTQARKGNISQKTVLERMNNKYFIININRMYKIGYRWTGLFFPYPYSLWYPSLCRMNIF